MEEDILLKDIINKVKENENNILPDLKNEGGSISAAVWKKYFKKKNNNDELNEYDEDDEFDGLMDEDINNKNNNNDFSYIGKKKERENENDNLNNNNSNIEDNIFEDNLDDEDDLD